MSGEFKNNMTRKDWSLEFQLSIFKIVWVSINENQHWTGKHTRHITISESYAKPCSDEVTFESNKIQAYTV